MKVFVIGSDQTPLMPMHAAKARRLLKLKKARLRSRKPACIQLLFNPETASLQPIKAGVGNGLRETGIAVVQERFKRGSVTLLVGKVSLSNNISRRLEIRRAYRRSRRGRLRYRKPRYDNRVRVECHVCGRNATKGKQTCGTHRMVKPRDKISTFSWLPPSLKAGKDSILRVISKLQRWTPVNSCTIELGRFDLKKISDSSFIEAKNQQNPMYERDTVKAALIFEYGRRQAEQYKKKIIPRCCYCNKEGSRLEIEHIRPKSKGGSDSWQNLTLACRECNIKKGDLTPQEAGMTLLYEPKPFHLSRVYKYIMRCQQGKNYLSNKINSYGLSCSFTYGQFISWQRKRFGIGKEDYSNSILIALSLYDQKFKPRLSINKVTPYYIWLTPTKRRQIFKASHYSPSKRKPKGFSSEATVNFGYTLKTLLEVNKACVIVWDKSKLVSKAVKKNETIPKNAVLILKKGDIIITLHAGRKITGKVSSLMSNGAIKIIPANQKKQIKVNPKKTEIVAKSSSVLFEYTMILDSIKKLTNRRAKSLSCFGKEVFIMNYKATVLVESDRKYKTECELPFVPQVGMLFSDSSQSIDLLRIVDVVWNHTEKRFYVYLGL